MLDYSHRSFKFYRNINVSNLVKFGPNWDYDVASFGLLTSIYLTLYPFKTGSKTFDSTYFNEKWSYALFSDINNGKPLFKNIWNNLNEKTIEEYITNNLNELYKIVYLNLDECNLWYSNQFHAIFDNLRYLYVYIKNHLTFLLNFYKNNI